MPQVNVHDAKTGLSKLLEEVEAGKRIVIARAGEPVAVLVPHRAAVRRRKLGLYAGQATLHADFHSSRSPQGATRCEFDELPEDIAAAFGGLRPSDSP
jgi:prevent-host-death family protein